MLSILRREGGVYIGGKGVREDEAGM